VVAGLAGEPEVAGLVEGRGIEVGVLAYRQREALHRARRGIDAHDRVEATVCDPRGAIGSDDHAMRTRPLAERNLLDLAGARIEPAKRALVLRRVPDRTIRLRIGRHVVRVRALGHVVVPHLGSVRDAASQQQRE
jgi:hypothetical protein